MKYLLQTDYNNALKFIDKCDDHIFKIKNWALVTISAVIAFGVANDKDIVIISNLAIILAFLYLELFYKSLQDDAILHSTKLEKRLEKYYSGDKEEAVENYSFGIGSALAYPKLKNMLSILAHPYRRHIIIFYSFLVIYSGGGFLIGRYLA